MANDSTRRVRLAIFLPIVAVTWHLASGVGMAGDRPLSETLVVRITQMGFAGETGTEYVIEPNGQWQARSFVNDRTTEELGQGVLPPEAMIELSHQVQEAQLGEVQADVGSVEEVNAAFVELRYGGSRALAPLATGASLAGDCPAPGGSPECVYLDLARNVEAKLGG